MKNLSKSFSQAEQIYYSRHFKLAEINISGQLKLKNARVLYIGAGGLGCAALPYLAGAGIGTLGIVDDDVVQATNLHRQILYSYADIGQLKVDVAKSRLAKNNPHIKINIYPEKLTHENALSLIAGYDVVVDGSDNFATRYIVNDACFYLKKPFVYAGISQFAGQCAVFLHNGGPCFRCIFAKAPAAGVVTNCATSGVLGVLPGIIGSIQALETIKLISKTGLLLSGRLLTFDAETLDTRTFEVSVNSSCVLCCDGKSYESLIDDHHESCSSVQKSYKQVFVKDFAKIKQDEDYLLIDVREEFEHDLFNLGGINISINKLSAQLSGINSEKKILLYCQSGMRSQKAADLLIAAGRRNIFNLVGGVDAWLSFCKS